MALSVTNPNSRVQVEVMTQGNSVTMEWCTANYKLVPVNECEWSFKNVKYHFSLLLLSPAISRH
jgi:hypothetical protein